MSVEIYQFNVPNGSYLSIFINGVLYSESFPNLSDMRRHFTFHPGRLQSNTLDETIINTRIVNHFGETKQHAVVSSQTENPVFFVTGPGGFMWNHRFYNLRDALDFAQKKATEFDNL